MWFVFIIIYLSSSTLDNTVISHTVEMDEIDNKRTIKKITRRVRMGMGQVMAVDSDVKVIRKCSKCAT